MKKFLTSIACLFAVAICAEPPYVPKPVQEHFSILVNAFQKEKWKVVVYEGRFITTNHPYSRFTPETYYYFAKGLYSQGKLAQANAQFANYLKADMSPRFFEEAIEARFDIAKRLETWDSELSINIYTEIASALPRKDMAAECLFRKAELLIQGRSYKEAIESYQSTIRRFPKNPFAAESYIGIAKVYLTQVSRDFPDPDLLNLAKINIDEFALAFPSEPRINEVRALFSDMREEFAKELYEIGRFYQRTKKPSAAKIYFETVLEQYPDSSYAKKSTKHLAQVVEALPA